MILGPILVTVNRFKYADFPTHYNDETGFSCIVSYPKETFNLAAPLKSLSYQVWVSIASGALAITLYLNFVELGVFRWFQSKSSSKFTSVSGLRRQITNFVWGNLVSQGRSYSYKQLAVRVAVGSWCVGCFFLIQIYCSTLTSHLMSPNQKPIINSVNDLPDTPGVSMTADKGFALDVILRDKNLETRGLKLLAEKFKRNPNLLCNTTAKCLQIVDDGHATYCNKRKAFRSLRTILRKDLKTTGTCHYLIIKDTLLNSYVFNPHQKNSPYTESSAEEPCFLSKQDCMTNRNPGISQHLGSA